MSDLIVSKPFLRGSKRYRRGESAPPDLDKVTLDEYKRLGLLALKPPAAASPAPTTTKPAGPAQTTAPSTGRKRESAKPKEVKAAPPIPAGDAASTATSDGTAAPGQGGEAGAPAVDAAPVDVATGEGTASSAPTADSAAAGQPQDSSAGASNG